MKASKFIIFSRNGWFLVLIVSLIWILSCTVYAQQEEEVKVFRMTEDWPCYIDPSVGSNNTSCVSLCNLYDSLVFPTTDGSVKPWLAKSWTISEDGLTYIFELVPGVRFHNGDELTADDVVFSMERFLNIGEGFAYLFINRVEEVKALEKYKVQFTLKETFGPFMGALVKLYILNQDQVMANIQKEGSYGEFGDYGKAWLVTNDAGSGPYKVKDMRTEEYLLMEQFDDYWAGWDKDAPQYVKLIGTTEAITVRTLMSRGELEMTDQWQIHENLEAIDQLPNTEMFSFYVGKVLYIMLNLLEAPTDDIHFRKALSYCIDYDQVNDIIFPGSRRSGPVAAGSPGYNPNLKLYELDMMKAEEELKKSAYYGKLDQYPFDLYLPPAVADLEKLAMMFQANAAKLGIKVNVIKVPFLTIIENLSRPESTPHGSLLSVAPGYAEAGSMLDVRYHSHSSGAWEHGDWMQNPEIDAMIDDAITTVDQEERFKKYYEVQEKIFDLCPSIFLMEATIKQVYRTDYVVCLPAEAVKQGKPTNPVQAYNFYFRDYRVTPETAQPPYTSFKP